jgi:ABC-type bacteriocin/lantibiotic exporter with double-glycine peptidase domain
LLDEATSALDAERERMFTEALLALSPELTIVAISHVRFARLYDLSRIESVPG